MPEEVNRILTDRISDLLLCPTQTAVDNLKAEGYDNIDTKVILSGDVMQDASLMFSDISSEFATVKQEIGYDPFALCTIHRAENTDFYRCQQKQEGIYLLFNSRNICLLVKTIRQLLFLVQYYFSLVKEKKIPIKRF